MDDTIAYQIAQHTYAALLWLLRYIDTHDLHFVPADRVDILEYHVNRIDALFGDIEDTPLRTDLKSRMKHGIRGPEDETEPWKKFYIGDFLPPVTNR